MKIGGRIGFSIALIVIWITLADILVEVRGALLGTRDAVLILLLFFACTLIIVHGHE